MPPSVCLGLASLLLAGLGLSGAHVTWRCPGPRHCQWEDPEKPGTSDPWETAPCDYRKGHGGRTPAYFEKGAAVCLGIVEFVGHPGSFTISLSTEEVTFLDTQAKFTMTLLQEAEDVSRGGEPDTGLHTLPLRLPANLTCESCTLQVQFYATDQETMYYDCTDIVIVEAADPRLGALGASSSCSSSKVQLSSDGSGAFTCAGPRFSKTTRSMSARIVVMVWAGIGGLIAGLWTIPALVVWFIGRRHIQSESGRVEPEGKSLNDADGDNRGTFPIKICGCFPVSACSYRLASINAGVSLVLLLLVFLTMAIFVPLFKNCTLGPGI